MEAIEQIISDIVATDRTATLWLNKLGAEYSWMDPFWQFMSEVKVWFPMYALVAGLLIWRLGWKKGLVAIAAVALAFFWNERVNNLIKALVERPRPCNDDGMLLAGIRVLEQGGGFSFPSGHACNSFGFAVCSAWCLKMDKKLNWNWYAVVIILWAFTVAVSRVMVACHFIGDVTVGAITGTIMAVIWYKIAKWLCGRIKVR